MISCKELTVKYHKNTPEEQIALDKIDLNIGTSNNSENNEKKFTSQFVAIIGSNGSGKSTLGHCFAGLSNNYSGDIFYKNKCIKEVKNNAKFNNEIGIVFQDPENQIITNFIDTEIAFSLENNSMPQEEMKIKVPEQIRRFGLEELINLSPSVLSGGQKQKLAIASILISNPSLLILDEPTSFLDPAERRKIIKLIKNEFDIRKDSGFNVILITQFSREALVANRLIVLEKGKIVADDRPEEIFQKEQILLNDLGIDIPIEYQFKNSNPTYEISSSIYSYEK